MSLLDVVPGAVTAAGENLQYIGDNIRAAGTAAGPQTTSIAAAAADEVSAAVADFFGTNAQQFQYASAAALNFHDEFISLLGRAATQYVDTEFANARQALVGSVNTPAEALLGHPLIGTAPANPADSAPTTTGSAFNFGPISVTQSASETGGAMVATVNTPFGPFGSVSLSANSVGFGEEGLLFNVNGTGALNTFGGPVQFLSETGTGVLSPDGVSLLANATVGPPSGPFWVSETETGGGSFVGDGSLWINANLSSPFGTFLGVTEKVTGLNGSLPWFQLGLQAGGLDIPIGFPLPISLVSY